MPRAVRRRSATRQTDCLLPDVEPLSPAGEADPGRGLEQVDAVTEKSRGDVSLVNTLERQLQGLRGFMPRKLAG
jgi:hypothetical protein